MSGDVRISGQFGAPTTNSHQVGQPANILLAQNRPAVMGEHQPAGSFDPAFVITHSGRVGSTIQHSAAAAFFAKKQPGRGVSSPRTSLARNTEESEEERPGKMETSFNFSTILARCPPPPPPALIKKISETKDNSGVGKVKVILRVANSGVIDEKKTSFFKMDKKKKQVTLLAPDNQRDHCELAEADTEPRRGLDVAAPKMFAFDGLYTDEDGQTELSGSSLCDLLTSVVNGSDGTLFCFGHANLGKSYTMIGSDESSRTIGLIPTAISWLFKAIKEKKDKSGARFSVRVSACEIRGSQEEMRDLLASQTESESGPRMRLGGLTIQNLAELRAGTAEKAGHHLDCALTNRSVDSQGRDSHFVFTLHLYQHSVATDSSANVLLGGRSRLHLIDFGWCERTKTLGGSITQAGLGNVILGILNGQRHLPFKESRVTGLLREVLGSVSCQAALLAHISPEPSHYSETLHTIQLASRIHRMRRKKMKLGGSSGGGSGSGGSSDENKRLGRFHSRGDSGKSSSDMTTSTDPSSSEQSCDTVIYLGPRDDEGTDCESPPVFLPALNSGDQRAVMSRVLKGSSAELPPAKYRSLDRKSQRSPLLPVLTCRSPSSSQHSTPVKTLSLCKSPQSTGSLPRNPRGKMPLYGRVAGYRQPATATDLPLNPRLSLASSGRSGQPQVQPGEVWVDNKPNCDRELLAAQYDASGIYGYMDEQKKQMIQQWVEGQAVSLHSAPPSHLTGLESLAWLQAQSEQSQYRCLTQFKVAESSQGTSEGSDGEKCDDDEMTVNNHPGYPADQEMKTRLRETMTDCQSNNVVEVKDSGDKSQESLARAKTTSADEIAQQSNEVKETSQTCQQKRENKCVEEGENRKTSSPSKQAEKQNLNLYLADNRSITSKSSTSSSRKSSVGTNTDNIPSSHSATSIPFNTKHQDPYGSSRKLTLRRTSELLSDDHNQCVDEMGGIRTLDELYSHCEQLVETLSQASEDLRAQQCHNDKVERGGTKTQEYLRIHQSDSNGIDDIEIYEVSEGSEASVEVSDIGCQATEEDIALCLVSEQPAPAPHLPFSGSEKHLGRILSDTKPAVQGPEDSQLSSRQERPERERGERGERGERDIESQIRHYEMIRQSQSQGGGDRGQVDMSDFELVCEEVSSNTADHEEFFNKKFDQLEKLHELYKSVSSISAASQSRLELNKNRCYENKNLLGQRSASFSLTGLMLGDLDNLSLPSTVSDDLNSLCSEPAWVTRQSNFLDINRNSTSCTNSAIDLSLSDLINTGLGLERNNIKMESSQPGERSDSPILEGIDSDLAKYAKLKDLEQVYKPKVSAESQPGFDRTDRRQLGSLRRADGASDPDLRSDITSVGSGSGLSRTVLPPAPPATLPRRSPGTGRSSSSSDPEEFSGSKTKTNRRPEDRGPSLPPPPPPPPLPCSQQEKTGKMIKCQKTDSESDLNIIKEKKIPRFSRLFSNVKKISRSPSQISKGSEEKTRSKASKRQTKTSSQISLNQSGQFKTEKLINDKPTKSKYRFFEKREKCLPKSPVNVTKNVKGTLSSEQLFEKPKTTKAKNSPIVQKSDKKDKKSVKTKNAGVCAVSCIPSPYSFPSKIKTKKNVNSETSGSGYDSGIESGIVTRLRSSSLVKIRGKGADILITGPPTHSSTPGGATLQRRSSRSHCASSGYESIGSEREGENTSVESQSEHGQERGREARSVPILQYDETTVSRLDRHWRFEEVKRLKKRQEQLKGELFSAKSRIRSEPDNWSYELHTEASGLDQADPNFVEAFEAETLILDKRVQACKSHVVLTTCFDNRPVSPHSHIPGCTADCDPGWADTETAEAGQM